MHCPACQTPLAADYFTDDVIESYLATADQVEAAGFRRYIQPDRASEGILVTRATNPNPRLPSHAQLVGLFGDTIRADDGACFSLALEAGSCELEYWLDGDAKVVTVSIDQPVEDRSLWEPLYQLLSEYHFLVRQSPRAWIVAEASGAALTGGLAEHRVLTAHSAEELARMITPRGVGRDAT